MRSKLGLLSEYECKLIIKQLALGVKDMYDLSIVHRDINIKNVLIHFPELDLTEEEMQNYDDVSFRREHARRVHKLMTTKRLDEVNFKIKIADLGLA